VETHETVLAALPLFKGLNPEHVQQLASCAEPAQYEAGQFLGRAGEAADWFWVIRQGRIALETHTPGRAPVAVQTVAVDDVIGWSWLIRPNVLRFDIHALTASRTIKIDGRRLREMCARDHELGYALIERVAQVLVRRMEAMSMQLMDFYGTHDGEHE
jgi:CRP/FNR family transcriptional regulator, cyclic AMP receptor protein